MNGVEEREFVNDAPSRLISVSNRLMQGATPSKLIIISHFEKFSCRLSFEDFWTISSKLFKTIAAFKTTARRDAFGILLNGFTFDFNVWVQTVTESSLR